MLPLALALLVGCWKDDTYALEGTVVEVQPGRLVVDHEAVAGRMDAMTMPFDLADPAAAAAVQPGDRITARLRLTEREAVLSDVRVVGHPGIPVTAQGPAPLHAGDVLPGLDVPVTGGGTWRLGEGQGRPTALTFLYTTCPVPEFCPLTVSRLQALQAAVGHDARFLAVSIDPSTDTPEVLDAFATQVGADAEAWRFGRLEGAALDDLAMRAALAVMPEEGRIAHGLRLLVLDGSGRLIERYDDNDWPLERVVQQLRTGGPAAPAGSDGTISRPIAP
jgi:protein SCO1/2